MDLLLVAVVLGLVEGITEFLPVSSTGHLILAGHLLGFEGPRAATFEIFIQIGAILAVVVLERRRFRGLLRPSMEAGFSGLRGCALLAVTTAPALAAGYFLHGTIKERLFSPLPVVSALFAGGIVILLVEAFRPEARIRDIDSLGWGQAVFIGLCQCLALWPGVSRSGATIVGGLLCGLDRRAAVTYSFLAAVPTMIAATAYDLFESRGALHAGDAVPFALGCAVSFAAAWAAVRSFVALLGRTTLRPFAWYRLVAAPILYLLLR